MEINADFSRRVVVHGDELEWQDSPIAGISRKMFDRIGDEVARATSLVRYDRDSQFSPHVHTGGEEFIVLDGSFDEGGDNLRRQSWLRAPMDSKVEATAGPYGARVWIKTGHLPFVNALNSQNGDNRTR